MWRRRFAGKLRSWLASHAWSCPAGRITSPKRGNRRQPTFFGPDDYPWSSAAPHAAGRDDRLVAAAPLLTLDPKWNEHLEAGVPEGDVGLFRRHEATGRPLGSAAFVSRLEALLGRILRSEPPGRKAKLGVGDN